MSVYILSGARTPSGNFLGRLSTVPAPRLGAVALAASLERVREGASVTASDIDEVFFGHVVQAGCGQAPARQAAIFAGLPSSVPCTTINKVCGSGMKSVICAAQSIATGDNRLVAAGGMENMSMAPHLLPTHRKGIKFGGGELKDAMQWDGLWDVYSDRAMGNCAEECVRKYNFSREEQDQFAIESFERANRAAAEGIFEGEIAPVTVPGRKGDVVVDTDEGPGTVNFEKIPKLRPAFEKDGTITAANASSINDGAAALILGGDDYQDAAKFRLVTYAGHAVDPTWFTTAPAMAMKNCLDKSGLSIADIDLFEINEAFAAVVLAAIRELELDRSKVNIYGGGISLGHPIGCSGARILVTLMNAMENKSSRYGMASICLGGGEALAMILERL